MTDESSQWQARCPSCGRAKTYAEMGGMRMGAASKGKRILGWCRQCRWFRWAIVEKVPVANPTLPQSQTNPETK
jgi:hypothetical protein